VAQGAVDSKVILATLSNGCVLRCVALVSTRSKENTMPVTLYFKRAKQFNDVENGTKLFLAQPGPTPQAVPAWVLETRTYELGVKDGSIINLTPPDQMPKKHQPKKLVVVDEVEESEIVVVVDDPTTGGPETVEEETPEQTEIPKAEFGAQPMTPVQPAPKVGGITSSTKKTKN
jgi:hypothetical protein